MLTIKIDFVSFFLIFVQMNTAMEEAWVRYKHHLAWSLIGRTTREQQLDHVYQLLVHPDENKRWRLSVSEFLDISVVELHPEWPWDYDGLSENPNLTWEIVQKSPHQPWNYYKLTIHPCVTWKIIMDHPELPWKFSLFVRNPNATWEILQQHPEIEWNYSLAAESHHIVTWEIVCSHPEIKWNYSALSRNQNITWSHITSRPPKFWECTSWNYTRCMEQTVTPKELKRYHATWTIRDLFQNFQETWYNIVDNFRGSHIWDIDRLMRNPHFTWETVWQVPTYNYSHPTAKQFLGIKYIRSNVNLDIEHDFHHFEPYLTRAEYDHYSCENPGIRYDQLQTLIHNKNMDETSFSVWMYLSCVLGHRYSFERLRFVHKWNSHALFQELFQYYFHPTRYIIFKHHGHFEVM